MYLSSKAQRAINKIQAFLAKTDYPKSKKISYETTKNSLRTYLSELTTLLYKEARKEDSRGSHYVSCLRNENSCRCQHDNARIEAITTEVQRLLRGFP
jgi:hypothetical protein